MDIQLEKNINAAVEYLKNISNDKLDFKLMDPIAKMMLVSLLHESQKIIDYIDGIEDKIIERFCEDFIPRREIEAMPALSVIEAKFKLKKDLETIIVGNNASFVYKIGDSKIQINYIPIFNTLCIPYQNLYILNPHKLCVGNKIYDIVMDKPNCIWIGINTKAEIETLKGLSLIIEGTNGVLPEHIFVGPEDNELEFSDMTKMEDIEMVEPFDSQQSSGQFFSIIENWKDNLTNMGNKSLLYITDETKDRDVFKQRAYPKIFEKWVEEEGLNSFDESTIWLRLEFQNDYVIPENTSITINVLPVTNIDINNVTLTQITPIAKLQKQDNSFFLQIIETSNSANKQGFNMSKEDIIVRDFDASCYHEGNLYRDVRTIYNHFIDDYYAFIEYNGIKDGETIKQLRDLINRIGKSVGTHNSKYSFDSGAYVMKNMNQYPQSSSIKVSFTSTLGKLGNTPKLGETMENKKLPSIEKELPIFVSSMGGADKANVDERYENLRYYTLTNDRLYTKKDIEAFLRKEIITEFGKEEFKRIFIELKIEGAAGETRLQRGLYITIKFKDKKNFEKAINTSLKNRLYQKIINRSCISMPVIVTLLNLDDC
ncbi:MAG: hypothetical protein IIV53_05275 [Bacteroidaceae bacterium]|nr:hypothetical protein [Bacteroidaceae bacterium]